MDIKVPRNTAEKRVASRRPYRPRKPYLPRPPSQLEIIQQHVMRLIKQQVEQRKREAKRLEEAAKEPPKIPEKKSRRKYRMTFVPPAETEEQELQGGQVERREVVTARDLARLMPPEQGVIVVCNPERSVCRIKIRTEDVRKEVETVAKPRYSNPSNMLIMTTKYDQPSDLDRILDSIGE
ncbi:Polyprotein [Caenorhabditis elegans]|uniref:Polyprotein n=1 Tax=Caenorhabditis elegans TaxID=6239 RepID=Q23291_CAEEL|nr:Polyprotein [Caenorhabditis elegans]CCD72489.2 Polyprotein [Caenorhabditis elegans]|eukprot:NP_001346717.1 Uncharacterized protein CELE_ZC404.1 [Caenorhabditis elegans]